jgi:hypothetical protein
MVTPEFQPVSCFGWCVAEARGRITREPGTVEITGPMHLNLAFLCTEESFVVFPKFLQLCTDGAHNQPLKIKLGEVSAHPSVNAFS